jgi:hypothetical protein
VEGLDAGRMVSCRRRAAGWRLQRTFSPNLLPRRMCRPTHTAGHTFPPSTILKIGAAIAPLHRAVSRAGYTHIRRPGVSYGYVAWRCSAEPVRRGFDLPKLRCVACLVPVAGRAGCGSVPWSWSGMVSPGAAECGADQCVSFVVVAGVAGAGGDGAASDCAVLNAAIPIAW